MEVRRGSLDSPDWLAGLCTEVLWNMNELSSLLFEINIVKQDRKVNNWENENVTDQVNGYCICKQCTNNSVYFC
jgi:hypothetical protein